MDRFVQQYSAPPALHGGLEDGEDQLDAGQRSHQSQAHAMIPQFELPNVNNVCATSILSVC